MNDEEIKEILIEKEEKLYFRDLMRKFICNYENKNKF